MSSFCNLFTIGVPFMPPGATGLMAGGTIGPFELLNSFCNSSNSFFNWINLLLSSFPNASNCLIASVVDNIS